MSYAMVREMYCDVCGASADSDVSVVNLKCHQICSRHTLPMRAEDRSFYAPNSCPICNPERAEDSWKKRYPKAFEVTA